MEKIKLGEICEHGQLKRSCELCEKDEQIAALKAIRDRVQADFQDQYGKRVIAEQQITSLTATVERLTAEKNLLYDDGIKKAGEIKRLTDGR